MKTEPVLEAFEWLVKDKLAALPELSDMRKTWNEKYAIQTIVSYISVLERLASLNKRDLEIIDEANRRCIQKKVEFGSASKVDVNIFVQRIGSDTQRRMADTFLDNLYMKSRLFLKAAEDLRLRMEKGHELSLKGVERMDGASPEVDYSIWGFTRGMKTKAMVHFIFCHLLERLSVQILSNHPNKEVGEMILHKDYFRNAMGETIRLMIAENQADKEMAHLWGTPREQGGLQWHRDERRQKIFKQVLEDMG